MTRSTTCSRWTRSKSSSSGDHRNRAHRVHARPHAHDSFVIVDEAQNSTSEQMKMVLTAWAQLEDGGKRDVTQIDLPLGKRSGLLHAERCCAESKGSASCTSMSGT